LADLKIAFQSSIQIDDCSGKEELVEKVDESIEGEHRFGLVTQDQFRLICIHEPELNLPVGTLQTFLDPWLESGGADRIDYVHGTEVVFTLGSRPGNAGFCLPAMQKQDLFTTVIKDGVLPRKTFSMGTADEKRFYFECRLIS